LLNYLKIIEKFGNQSFIRSQILDEIKRENPNYNEKSLNKSLERLIEKGFIIRVAEGMFVVPERKKNIYLYKSYNDTAINVRKIVKETFPLIDFTMFEMVQLNQFVNHLIAKNTIFIEIEKDVEEHVFEKLKEEYNSVLYFPKPDDYFRYGEPDTIIIRALPCRYPKNPRDKHGTSIEKLIVDLFANEIIWNSISQGDYPDALENMFSAYQINETKLFRYAIIRRVENELRMMLEKANIKLYTK